MTKLKMLKPRLQVHRSSLPIHSSGPKPEIRDRGRPWMRKRERILMRDCGLCQCTECKSTGRVLPASEVDHVVPRWKWAHLHDGVMDGCEEDDNLRSMHPDCHRKKTKAEEQERRALGL